MKRPVNGQEEEGGGNHGAGMEVGGLAQEVAGRRGLAGPDDERPGQQGQSDVERGMVRNSSPPTIPLNRRNVFVFRSFTASSTALGSPAHQPLLIVNNRDAKQVMLVKKLLKFL